MLNQTRATRAPMSKSANHHPFHPVSAPDFLPLPQLQKLQLQRLQAIIGRAYERVALFRQRMDERGLRPAAIEKLEDIAQLPFTAKTDLRDTYPFGLFASPMKEIVRVHASSGTTGKPIVVAYTQADVQVWTNVMVRSFAACGLHEGDIIQNAYGYGLFTGGLGAHYGAEALGATVIPISGGNTQRQLMVMQDFGVTAICCTPSYFLHLIDQASKRASTSRNSRCAPAFSAPSVDGTMRQRIQQTAGLRRTTSTPVEMWDRVWPWNAVPSGPHIFEDYFSRRSSISIGQACADGEEGELVADHFGKQQCHDPISDARHHGAHFGDLRMRRTCGASNGLAARG